MKVGEAQAVTMPADTSCPTATAPRENRPHLRRANTDNNAKMFKQGQDNILDPLIKAGKITVLLSRTGRVDWKPRRTARKS